MNHNQSTSPDNTLVLTNSYDRHEYLRYSNKIHMRLDNVTANTVIIENENGKLISIESLETFLSNNSNLLEINNIEISGFKLKNSTLKIEKTIPNGLDELEIMLYNYWNGNWKKSPEIIGRDYERYIGYLYEKQGFTVDYNGVKMKLEDGGIDLICKKKEKIELVQCKYWGKDKIIHEKHINQLFGAYSYHKNKVSKGDMFDGKNKREVIRPVFITNIILSEIAKDIAESLGIEVREKIELDITYPCIKCNISHSGKKIYHLPFDAQYDSTKIKKKGERYVNSIAEAEELGFKHATK
jgi:hypothetical protein